MHYLLIYDLTPDYLERRGEFRKEHLDLTDEAAAAGLLLVGGALADPADQAILMFQADSPEPIEAFARRDPYVVYGLVTEWRVRPWVTVAGPWAHTPVKL